MKKYIMEVTEKVLKTEEEIKVMEERRNKNRNYNEFPLDPRNPYFEDEYKVSKVISIELTEEQMKAVKAAAIEAI